MLNSTELMTKPVKDLIAQHNAMTGAKKILGAWHDSKAKLVTRMLALDEANEKAFNEIVGPAKSEPVKSEPVAKTTGSRRKDVAKVEPKGTHSNLIGDYCAKHGLNPRHVRAKLRKLGRSAPYTAADFAKYEEASK